MQRYMSGFVHNTVYRDQKPDIYRCTLHLLPLWQARFLNAEIQFIFGTVYYNIYQWMGAAAAVFGIGWVCSEYR